jgi:hypothetical protein
MRQLLQLDAEALAARGLLNRAQVDELKHTNNHHALAYDVMGLAGLILGVYDDPRVRLMTTRQELLEASRRANELFTQLGTRQFGANAGDEVKVLRRKAFALMLQLFTELESFITFARRKQRDAKAFLAPLYAKRGRKGNGSQGVEDTEDDDSPSSPPGQSSDGLPFDVEELNRNVAAATVGAGEVVRPGFPGGLAFLPEDQAESKDKAK